MGTVYIHGRRRLDFGDYRNLQAWLERNAPSPDTESFTSLKRASPELHLPKLRCKIAEKFGCCPICNLEISVANFLTLI